MQPPLPPTGKSMAAVCLLYTFIVGSLSQSSVKLSPNVLYVDYPQTPFFYARNITIAARDTNMTLILDSSCQCRVACLSWAMARSCSGVPLTSGKVECRFSVTPPTNHSTENHAGAIYYFKKDSLAGEVSLKVDRLMYFKSNITRNFSEAVAYCRKIPGFRLVIFKYARQLPVIQEVMGWGQFYVHLQSTPNGLEWGDGTLYGNTELPESLLEINGVAETIFRTNKLFLSNNYPTQTYGVLCQANPLGETW